MTRLIDSYSRCSSARFRLAVPIPSVSRLGMTYGLLTADELEHRLHHGSSPNRAYRLPPSPSSSMSQRLASLPLSYPCTQRRVVGSSYMRTARPPAPGYGPGSTSAVRAAQDSLRITYTRRVSSLCGYVSQHAARVDSACIYCSVFYHTQNIHWTSGQSARVDPSQCD